MKKIFFITFILSSTLLFSQKAKIHTVVSHDRQTVTTDPSQGINPYSSWAVFPSEKTPIRKITMNVTLGTPDTLPTAHWDYLDHIYLVKQGGVNGKKLNYEIGRMLTPYGAFYTQGWSWKWQVDVSDFAPFLRDSVEIKYVHAGWEPVTVGWALTISFDILEGDPIMQFQGITPLWNKGYKYGDENEKLEDNLLPINFVSPEATEINRIRIQHTGHGMDRPNNCSEFCSRWRKIEFDGKEVDHRDMWKKCGTNPLYPQAGTWLYDRAYWCPGDLQDPDIIDVFAKGGNHNVSMTMQEYTATENIQAVENISAYMFHYGKPLKKHDVALEHISVPSDEQRFSRENPASFDPKFTIRNLGSENLKSVIVEYRTEGFAKKSFKWSGNLKFNETAEITIPEQIDMKEGENKFTVLLKKPNGKKDGWNGDNQLSSNFVSPMKLPTDFIIQFKTNNSPADNEISIVGKNSELFHKISPTESDSNKVFVDTISLAQGQYFIELIDTVGNGLEFWAQPQFGYGYLRILDMEGNLIHAFESDCGSGEKLSFSATNDFVLDNSEINFDINVFPRRFFDDEFSIYYALNKSSKMRVEISVDDKIYETHEYEEAKNGKYTYYVSNLPKGFIVLSAFIDDNLVLKTRVAPN